MNAGVRSGTRETTIGQPGAKALRNDRDPESDDVLRRVRGLGLLHEGEKAFMHVVACGPRVIPALRELLFEREPSGPFQPRCLAVDALAVLGAKEVLLDFLDNSPREIEDPVERTGEEAVINATARALAGWHDDRVFAALLRLAEGRPSLAGVIETLGDFHRPETLPSLIKALAEDFSREAAEAAIRKLGVAARPALVRASTSRLPSEECESETSLRRRRSALRLLAEIGVPRTTWPSSGHWSAIATFALPWLHASSVSISAAAEKQAAARRLSELLVAADPISRSEIEDVLIEPVAVVPTIVVEARRSDPGAGGSEPEFRCPAAPD